MFSILLLEIGIPSQSRNYTLNMFNHWLHTFPGKLETFLYTSPGCRKHGKCVGTSSRCISWIPQAHLFCMDSRQNMWTYGCDLCFGLGGWNWFQDSCLKWSSISPKILNHQLTPPQLLAYQFKRLNHGGKASFAKRWDSLKLYNIIYKSWNELSTKGQLVDVSNHLCHPAKRGRAFLTQPASEWKACLWVWLFGKFPRGLRIYQTILIPVKRPSLNSRGI